MQRVILGPVRPIIEEIRSAARRHQGGRARVAVAWARDEGVCQLLDALDRLMPKLEVVVGINERGTTVEALLRLLRHGVSLRYFFKHPSQTFHPKLYWIDDGLKNPVSSTVIVGSSNLTSGGMLTNFEASLVVQVEKPFSQADRQFLSSVNAAWNQLVGSPFSHVISKERDIQQLYELGYLVLDSAIVRRRRLTSRIAAPHASIPTAPPPRMPRTARTPIAIPFPTGREPLEGGGSEYRDPEGSAPLPDRFFVRTLTANDIAKLHGRQVGTVEPDLGETARDGFPAFWGWPDRYQNVVRRLPRLEWTVPALLISASTPPQGVSVTLTLWYRTQRPGHAAEHRLSLQPISTVRPAVPASFDTSDLLVVEQAPAESTYRYVVRLITSGDTAYQDFATYLTESRPRHRYGYGP